MNSFGKVDLLKEAWELVKKNVNLFAMLIGVYAVYYIIQIPFKSTPRYDAYGYVSYNPASGLVSLIFAALNIVLELGVLNLVLHLVDGKKADIKDLYTYPNLLMKVLKTFAGSILLGIAVVVGLILLVIPGIYIAIRSQFFMYYIVDKDAGVMDALKMSWNLTKGGMVNLFLFDLLMIVVNLVGALLFGLGLLVTVPLTCVAGTLLYRRFQK